jgi:glyoxylase-like metal-dependent hydrolase (beta-lactamase superfamily II)
MTLDGTNTWTVEVDTGVLVVDPGPPDRGHLDRVIGGSPLAGVLLTHRHGDHAAALEVLPESTPVFAADLALARGAEPLREGVRLVFPPVAIEVLATPGHTDDSVCLRIETGDGPFLLTGDTLLGGRHGTFVSRHTGDLAALLSSLQRLCLLTGLRGLPGHGDDIADVGAHASAALAYRRLRLERLEQLLRAEPDLDLEEHVAARHPTDPMRRSAAMWMTRVESEYLRSEGRLPPLPQRIGQPKR